MSKAALNQGLRHLACELQREHEVKGEKAPVVLAIHPGEVRTDMATRIEVPWVVEGQMEVEESVNGVLEVIEKVGWGGDDECGRVSGRTDGERGEKGATFWDWNGERHPW